MCVCLSEQFSNQIYDHKKNFSKFDMIVSFVYVKLMIDYYEICGYGAGILFATSLIPQLYRSCQTKVLDDISFVWQFIFIIAIILGLIYSIHNDLKPIYISSIVELLFMIILVILKLIYNKSKDDIDIDIENP